MREAAAQMCLEKCSRGNVFCTRAAAKLAAKKLSRATGEKINAFACVCCERWHLGNRQRWRAARQYLDARDGGRAGLDTDTKNA